MVFGNETAMMHQIEKMCAVAVMNWRDARLVAVEWAACLDGRQSTMATQIADIAGTV
jgi:hypothetical protein